MVMNALPLGIVLLLEGSGRRCTNPWFGDASCALRESGYMAAALSCLRLLLFHCPLVTLDIPGEEIVAVPDSYQVRSRAVDSLAATTNARASQ